MANSNSPAFKSAAYNANVTKTTFMRDVTKGTKHVNSLREKYLPKYNREEKEDYDDRLLYSELLPSTQEAVKSITGKLLLKPTNAEDIQEAFDLTNVDNAGTSLEAFEHKLTNEAITDGMNFILVDYPVVQGVVTAADKARVNAKPYFIIIKSTQLLNFRTEIINNQTKLSQVTIQMSSLVPDGDFGEKEEVSYKVYKNVGGVVTIDTWGDNNGEVTKSNETITITGVNDIPLVPFYTNKKGFFEAESILQEMAVLNISWYNLNSALKRSLIRCCDPTPVLKGSIPSDENGNDADLSVGSSQLFVIDEESSFEWVGADGSIIQPTKDEIKDIETRMSKIATELLNSDAEMTATEANISNTDTQAKLTTIASNRENALNKAYEFYCQFASIEPKGKLVVNRDFSSTKLTPQEVENLRQDYLNGIITKETYIKERQQGGELLSIDDILAEITKAEDELTLDNQENFGTE